MLHWHQCVCVYFIGRCNCINTVSLTHFTLLSLKRICILQLMITSKIYGMVSTKCKWISRCIHYKNNSIGWHQYDSFSIQHSNGHRHKTPAIATCFTFYTTVSPLRRKYMEERRERVIRLWKQIPHRSIASMQKATIKYLILGRRWPEFQQRYLVNDRVSLDGDSDLPLEHTPRQRQRSMDRHRRLGSVTHVAHPE